MPAAQVPPESRTAASKVTPAPTQRVDGLVAWGAGELCSPRTIAGGYGEAERQRVGRPIDMQRRGASPIGKPPFLNGSFDRHFAVTAPDACMRVPTLHEKLEDQHGQSECVVILVPEQMMKVPAL